MGNLCMVFNSDMDGNLHFDRKTRHLHLEHLPSLLSSV